MMLALVVFVRSAFKQLMDVAAEMEKPEPDPQVVHDLLAGAHRHLEVALVILAALQREAQA